MTLCDRSPSTLRRASARFGAFRLAVAAGATFAILTPAGPSLANERHFAFTYESAVLPKGGREIEVWTTPRIARADFYVRFDQRVEFEVGVTDRLMTAFYLNASGVNGEAAGTRQSTFRFEGVSSEWKYKLSDPVADGMGVALYGEWSGGPASSELEAKLILDKYVDRLLLAANFVAAHEWDYSGVETETEQEVEVDVAAAYFLRPGLSAGMELRNHNEIVEGDWEHSALFAGPVVGYGAEDWWLAVSVLAQLPAPKDGESTGDTDSRVLDEHEKWNGRVLFSFHL